MILIVFGLVLLAGCAAPPAGDAAEAGSGQMDTPAEEESRAMEEEAGAAVEEEAAQTEELPPEAEPGAYVDVSPEKAKELIEGTPDLIVIDVSPHYDDGHLPGAVHYYLGDGSLDAAIPALDKERPYLVYCHVDSAAIQGAQKLVDAGFSTVYRLEGNFAAWVAAGYEIEK